MTAAKPRANYSKQTPAQNKETVKAQFKADVKSGKAKVQSGEVTGGAKLGIKAAAKAVGKAVEKVVAKDTVKAEAKANARALKEANKPTSKGNAPYRNAAYTRPAILSGEPANPNVTRGGSIKSKMNWPESMKAKGSQADHTVTSVNRKTGKAE